MNQNLTAKATSLAEAMNARDRGLGPRDLLDCLATTGMTLSSGVPSPEINDLIDRLREDLIECGHRRSLSRKFIAQALAETGLTLSEDIRASAAEAYGHEASMAGARAAEGATANATIQILPGVDAGHPAGPFPTRLMPGAGAYVGYFRNDVGEKMFFVKEPLHPLGRLIHSDFDWKPVDVVDGIPLGLSLDADERQWLAAVWSASQAGRQNAVGRA